METEFTPLASLFGGALIGIAALTFMFLNGRIAGISGILGAILPPESSSSRLLENSAFLIGLAIAFPVYLLFGTETPAVAVSSNVGLLVVGGLLVGMGTIIGSGCTSGHGVCGLSRFSQRSLVATLVFMLTAAITVFALRHVFGG